jgi:hypothetical protein
VEANARLTGYAAVVLVIPLGAEIVTGIRPGLLAGRRQPAARCRYRHRDAALSFAVHAAGRSRLTE